MASNFPDDTRPARPLRTALIIAVLALLAGMALMAWAMTRWHPQDWLRPAGAVKLADVPAAVTPTTQSAPALLPTDGQAQVMDARVAEIEARLARIDLRAAAAAGNAARAEGLLVAFAARRALDRGVALGYIEGQLRQRFGNDQPAAVGAIIAAAQAPVTLDALRQGLDQLAPKIAAGNKTEGWWQSTRSTLGSLFIVRREGTPSPAPDERFARAHLLVDSGQVDGALAEIARLPSGSETTSWMSAARRYIAAHRALDLVEATALTRPVSTLDTGV